MIKKNVENSGGTVRLGYSFNCSSTPKPTIDWDYTQTDGFHVTIGDSEITVVVDENDTGSNSRKLVITPYIDGDPCKDNRIQISQGAGDEPGECSYEVTAAKTVINCEDDHVVRFTFKKVEEDEPTGCKISLTAKTINGLTYDYNTMRLDASGDTLTFSHGDSPSPGPGPSPTDAESWLKAAYCVDYSSPYDHQSKGDGEFTVIVVNNSSNDFLWSGKIKVPISKNGQATSTNFYYREPSYVACHYIDQNGGYWAYGAHMAYATNTNMVFKKGTTTTWRVPIHRSTPATRLTDSRCSSALEEDLRGATILTTSNSELSCAGGTVGKEASYGTITFVNNLICTITKQGGTSSSLSIETGATYTFTVTGSTNYNFDDGNTEIVGSGNKAYLNHNSSGSQVIVPLNAGEWYEGN